MDKYFTKMLDLGNAKEWLSISMPLIASQLAIAVPYVIGYAILGSTGDIIAVTALGLSWTFLNLFAYAFFISIFEIGGTNFAKAFGAKNAEMMAGYLYKTLIAVLLIQFLYLIPIAFSYQVLVFINIDSEISAHSSHLIKLSWWIGLFQNANLLLQTYLMSQNIFKELSYITLSSIVYTLIFGYYFIIYLKLKAVGFIYARIIQEILILAYCVYLVLYKSSREFLAVPSIALISRDFKVFLKKTGYSLLSVYGEFLAFEFNTILAAQLGTINEMATWSAFFVFTFVVYYASLGISNTFRTKIGQMVGERQVAQARSESVVYYLYFFWLSLAISVLAFFWADDIARVFINSDTIQPSVASAIKAMCPNMYGLLILYSFFALFRILHLDFYFFVMLSGVYPVCVLACSWFFAFAVKMRVNGIIWGWSIATTLFCVVFFFKIYKEVDWEKQIENEFDTEILLAH